jgi:SpoVK/Ycf46/Vps4 family AAA+-type ATPase
MKSLVGESSQMILDLVNRAAVSPYILCSLGIDEVDGLVPDRKDKDEKNKGEGISMLLSVIGGNKDVSNLVFMTSTNYLKKIDEAIRRRLSGHYQVGRPNPKERTQIILKKVKYLNAKNSLLNHIIKITANFTGAAMGGLANYLLKSLKTKRMDNKPE